MTVTLELPSELEADLLADAKNQGLPLEIYLVEHVIRDAAEKRVPSSRAKKKTVVQLFAPLRGLDLAFSRNPSTSRAVDL